MWEVLVANDFLTRFESSCGSAASPPAHRWTCGPGRGNASSSSEMAIHRELKAVKTQKPGTTWVCNYIDLTSERLDFFKIQKQGSCISPYSSWGPGPASFPDGHRRSNGNSQECLGTPLHTHSPHIHPHLTSDRAELSETEVKERWHSRVTGNPSVSSGDVNFQFHRHAELSHVFHVKHEEMGEKTLESSGFWKLTGLYLSATYTTLKGHEKDRSSFSEEIHWGYKKSGFHCGTKQCSWVINDFGISLRILLIVAGINLITRDRSFILARGILPILKYTVPPQMYWHSKANSFVFVVHLRHLGLRSKENSEFQLLCHVGSAAAWQPSSCLVWTLL